jgi:hypothetical protein
MKHEIINTDFHTFYIEFAWKSTDNRFIVQGHGLIECLKKYDLNGIKAIKIFEPSKGKFMRVSKATIFQLFSWDTETMEYLKNHYFFK